MRQIGDHITSLESMDMTKAPKSYIAMLSKYKAQYKKLYEELDIKNIPSTIDLKAYISKCLEILNFYAKDPHNRWQYYLEEVDHKTQDVPDFYGDQTYHNYVYQVTFMCGNRELPFCTVNRQLLYSDKMGTIDFLTGAIHAPFNLRLDEDCNEFDKQTISALKLAPFKVLYEQKQNKAQEEMSFIQKRIRELQQQYDDKHEEYCNYRKQLSNLDKQEEILNKK